MYTANSPKELKKLMKEDKYPILVVDEKTQRLVEVLESLKTKGIKETAKDEIKKAITSALVSITSANAISEPAIIAILSISMTSIIALYAIYKNKNIKLKYNKDGSVELSTGN
jgi:hypothetical protein